MLRAPKGSISAKKNRAAIVGPSSMTPKDSVKYEFIAHSATEKSRPSNTDRAVIGATAGAGWSMGAETSNRGVSRRAEIAEIEVRLEVIGHV